MQTTFVNFVKRRFSNCHYTVARILIFNKVSFYQVLRIIFAMSNFSNNVKAPLNHTKFNTQLINSKMLQQIHRCVHTSCNYRTNYLSLDSFDQMKFHCNFNLPRISNLFSSFFFFFFLFLPIFPSS